MMINYSSIPIASKTYSPWASLIIAAGITFLMFSAILLGVLVTLGTTQNQANTVLAVVNGTFIFGFVVAVLVALLKGYQTFTKQKQWMKSFAIDNGWDYDDTKRSIDDLCAFPASFGIKPNMTKVRCTVSGNYDNKEFELAHVTYVQSTDSLGRLMNTSRNRFAWMTVISLKGQPQLHNIDGLLYDEDGSHTYIVCPSNALYLKDIQSMFDSFATSS